MRKSILLVLSAILCFTVNLSAQKPSEAVVDGIRHIRNTEIPAKGTVILELEKMREINPFDNPDINLKMPSSVVLPDGGVILLDVNGVKAYLFSKEGKYVKSLVRNGQGPGEFSPGQLLFAHPMKDQIWFTGAMKLAKFDRDGRLVADFRTNDYTADFLDENSYVTEIEAPAAQKFTQTIKIRLRRIDKNNQVSDGPVYMEGTFPTIIPRPDGRGGFADIWCMPKIEYAVDAGAQRVYTVDKSGYSIHVSDKEGRLLFIIEKPCKGYRISKRELAEWKPWVANDASRRWQIDAYPDALMPIQELRALPNGFLGVYRISGPGKFEIDAFDREGRFQYIIKIPETAKLGSEQYLPFGLSGFETKDDFPVYVEYRVKNLPEIFGK